MGDLGARRRGRRRARVALAAAPVAVLALPGCGARRGEDRRLRMVPEHLGDEVDALEEEVRS